MTGRLVAALVLVVSGLVLGPAAPASACGCVTDRPEQQAANAAVAFVGVLKSQRVGESEIAHRFTVVAVHRGEVHGTQDVVTPDLDEAGCGVDWEPGARMVVLGYLDEESRTAANLCTGSATAGTTAYDVVVATLGARTEPLPGRSVVELEQQSGAIHRWFTLAVGVIGLAGVGVLARRRWGTPA